MKSKKILIGILWLIICAVLGLTLPKLPFVKDAVKIKIVKVKGTDRLKEEDIQKLFANQNWFFLDKSKIEKQMKEKYQFIKQIQIKKLFVGQLNLYILEREPFAVLYKNKEKYIIDEEGFILSYYKIKDRQFPKIYYKNNKIEPEKIKSVMKIDKIVSKNLEIKSYIIKNNQIFCKTKDDKIIVFNIDNLEEGFKKFKTFVKKVNIDEYKYIDFSFYSMVISRR